MFVRIYCYFYIRRFKSSTHKLCVERERIYSYTAMEIKEEMWIDGQMDGWKNELRKGKP